MRQLPGRVDADPVNEDAVLAVIVDDRDARVVDDEVRVEPRDEIAFEVNMGGGITTDRDGPTGEDVDVIEEEAVVNCECGYNGPPKVVERGHDFVVWACPSCDRLYPRAVSGDRIVLAKVVVERPKV